MLISPAYAQGASGGSDFLIQLVPILLMFVIFYMLLLRPQQQRVKQHREMVANLRRGDTVVTSRRHHRQGHQGARRQRDRGRDRRQHAGARGQGHRLRGARQGRARQRERVTGAGVACSQEAREQSETKSSCCISQRGSRSRSSSPASWASSSCVPNFFSKETLAQWPRWVPKTAAQPRPRPARRRASAAVDGSGGRAQGLAQHAARRRAQAAARGQDPLHRARHHQQCRAGPARQGGRRRRGPEDAARADPADRQPHARHQHHRPGGDEGRRRADPLGPHRSRPPAPHLQRHRRRHRDGAPARRCHGHHRAEYRAPGQLAHPRAGAGAAGHGAAQGADRQDGALELPRGARDR